jgi:hypothetical protein
VGRRDNSPASQFHGHPNTLTVVLDTVRSSAGSAGEVRVATLDANLKSFHFHAEEPAQHRGEDICVDERNEARGSLA